ncbi:MAG: hypothetical protein IJO09_06610 [Oscillospiraceae bacterium]|nr:hypothetical protein [Oscillospiraceae bacterium]
MKKFLSVFLTISILMGLMSVGVFAADGEAASSETTFTVDFGTAHDTGSLANGTYMAPTTYGSNWRVNSISSAKQINGNSSTSTAVRVQRNVNAGYNFTQIKYLDGKFGNSIFTVDFTAPSEGYYDVSGLVVLQTSAGYGNIYINGICVGTIDGYDANGSIYNPSDVQSLAPAHLKAGEYANTLTIIPTGASSGSGTMVSVEGVSFTKRSEDSFKLDFGDATRTESLNNTYTTTASYGYNWKIEPLTPLTASGHVTGTSGAVRIQNSKVHYDFSQFNDRGDITFRFTADEGAGMYDVSAFVISSSTGSGTVHINGEYVGTINRASSRTLPAAESGMTAIYFDAEEQKLSKVYLHGGEYANTLTITPATSSTITMQRFDFIKTTSADDSFKVDFGRAFVDSLATIKEVQDYCVSGTCGDNWKIDAENTASTHINETSESVRIQLALGSKPANTYNFTTIYPKGDFAVKFTAPSGAGTYDISALMLPMTDGGYGDIYVNGAYVGSVNSYDSVTHLYNDAVVTQSLMTTELKAGEYANTLLIRPVTEHKKLYPQSFEFTKTTSSENSGGMQSESYETSGRASVSAISAYTTDGTVIDADIIGNQSVSMGDKVSLSAPGCDGYNFLYWALGTSDRKRIVSHTKDFTYKPREGATQLIAIYEKVGEGADKAEFYNANGELIDINTTGVFPSLPSLPAFGRASGWKCYNNGESYDGTSAIVPEGTVIYVAQYDELRTVTINGETYNYGDTVTLTATVPEGKYFKGFVKNGETVCTDETYTFLAYEDCTITEEYADSAPLTSKLVKIVIDSFVSGDITAVMAEFIGIDNAVEKGIMYNGNKIAMNSNGNQFTVTADEDGTYIGYAILKNGNSYTLLTDGEYEK